MMRMNFKRSVILSASVLGAIILLFALRVCSYAQSTLQESFNQNVPLINNKYISPTPGEISIIASSPWVDGKPTNLTALSEIKSCGFNAILSYTTVPYFTSASPMLAKVGLKAIVGFPEFSSSKGLSIIESLKNDSVIGAWRIVDEPREIDFNKWSRICDNIEKIDSAHMSYVNLIGAEAKEYFLGDCQNYHEFLNKFQLLFRPAVWSYDLYPLSIKKGELSVDYDMFYRSLEDFSQLSLLTRRPFWAYCQSMAFSNKSIERPAATLAYLSYEAFSALGYGAKGIVYWTYCQRPSSERTEYISALVDLDYNKYSAWYAAQQVNFEIKALNDVFLDTKFIGTWHLGNNQPASCKKFSQGVAGIKSISGGKKGVQISQLESDKSYYVIIVNKDVENNQKISISFNDGITMTKLSPVKISGNYSLKESKLIKNCKETLPAGRYLILRYNKSK